MKPNLVGGFRLNPKRTHKLDANRKEKASVPDTPNSVDLYVIQKAGTIFASYVSVLKCTICGWRAYREPWPRVCGKCSSLSVFVERAPAEPIDAPGRKQSGYQGTQPVPAQLPSMRYQHQKQARLRASSLLRLLDTSL